MRSLVTLAVGTLLASCAATPAPQASTPTETASVLRDCSPGTYSTQFEGLPVRVHIPQTADAGSVPAVVVLHGAGDDGEFVAGQTEMDTAGEANGFMTVYPTDPDGLWSLTNAGAARLNRLADNLGCADPRRVYLSGFSRGSAMVFNVACAPGARSYAAFAGVAFPDFRPKCRRSRPAPIVYLHGTADQTVSFDSGYRLSTGRQAPAPKVAMRKWAKHNDCRSGPKRTRIGDDVLLRAWSTCAKRAAVHFYTIRGGGHQWPFKAIPDAPLLKPGQSWAAVGADEVMWRFFATRSLRN